MEKSENKFNNHKPIRNNYKTIILGFLISTFLLSSCQKNKTKQITGPQENKIETLSNPHFKPISTQETWEYKIYKLGLGSIVPIKGDIQRAKVKISNTPELKKILTGKDAEFETIMPSIIKESMMNNESISKSGAVGYFQLKPIAVKDVTDFYKIENLNLDVNNPVDNIILGSLYRKKSMKLLKQGLSIQLSDSDLEKLMILSYNAGPERIKKLFNESRAKNYEEFQKFLARKIGVKKESVKKWDKTYSVYYNDPLTGLDLNNLKSWENKKIAEGLRYVAIIVGISQYIQSNQTMQIIGTIKCDKNNTLFSSVKKLRDQGVFKENASINDICKIILESNGYGEKETPDGKSLYLIFQPLEHYLQKSLQHKTNIHHSS